MKITNDSHLDHGLSIAHVEWVTQTFLDRANFFIETVELPPHLAPVRCALHGPVVREPAVPDSEASYVVRGDRKGPSRTCARPFGVTRILTVIAGPSDNDPCVLYTAFGGPLAPREPWDPTLDDAGRAESEAFWSEHALSL